MSPYICSYIEVSQMVSVNGFQWNSDGPSAKGFMADALASHAGWSWYIECMYILTWTSWNWEDNTRAKLIRNQSSGSKLMHMYIHCAYRYMVMQINKFCTLCFVASNAHSLCSSSESNLQFSYSETAEFLKGLQMYIVLFRADIQ